MHQISSAEQACSEFGIHPKLPALKDTLSFLTLSGAFWGQKWVQELYDEGSLAFITDVGSLVEPLTPDMIGKGEPDLSKGTPSPRPHAPNLAPVLGQASMRKAAVVRPARAFSATMSPDSTLREGISGGILQHAMAASCSTRRVELSVAWSGLVAQRGHIQLPVAGGLRLQPTLKNSHNFFTRPP